ncbi:MAG: 4-(cytidine 5'-diphospho)-2-C-methyl-D-erythritol kinase [Nitrospirae bacterium]|nr:4-(cytidine 5'-diphospho)-2-C-methyl-D-erythritol kinase [Nitrospirota bacterium]
MLRYRVPAKINWFIYVTGKRDDGYHNLLSIMQTVSLYDELTIEPAESLELVTDMNVSVADNLVFKAASLLKVDTGSNMGAKIHLKKVIPTEAGLGGGSSDAAFTLLGLNNLWNLGLSTEELTTLAARLGSDVPFFVSGNCAFVSGRGEVVTPLNVNAAYDVLIVKPPFSISTAQAYKKITTYSSPNYCTIDLIKHFCDALDSGSFNALLPLMKNDIQEAIMADYPMIDEIRLGLLRNGAQAAMLSGSGSAVFGIFKDAHNAEDACRNLANSIPNCQSFLVKTL